MFIRDFVLTYPTLPRDQLVGAVHRKTENLSSRISAGPYTSGGQHNVGTRSTLGHTGLTRRMCLVSFMMGITVRARNPLRLR